MDCCLRLSIYVHKYALFTVQLLFFILLLTLVLCLGSAYTLIIIMTSANAFSIQGGKTYHIVQSEWKLFRLTFDFTAK